MTTNLVTKETTRKPKDWKKFVNPKSAAKILRRLARAIEQAKPDAMVHFRIKVRIFREAGR